MNTLTVPPHVYTRTNRGDWLVFDPVTRRSWRVGEGASLLLLAIRNGWQPGRTPPACLGRYAGVADHLNSILDRLRAEGLLIRDGPVAGVADKTAVHLWRRWSDLRLRVFTVPAVPLAWRRLILFGILTASFLGAFLLALNAYIWSDRGIIMDLIQTAEPLSAGHLWPWVVAIVILFKIPHETGHAVAMSAAIGEPITVGLRLFYGFPHAYADTTAIVTVRERWIRATILGAGVGVELLAWGFVGLTAHLAPGLVPRSVLAAVLLGGPLSLAFNLLLPFLRNDGYLLVQELSEVRNLSSRARQAAALAFLGPRRDVRPWWLPWYGLLDIHSRAVPFLLFGVMLGSATDGLQWGLWLGAVVGGAAVVAGHRQLHQLARVHLAEQEEPVSASRNPAAPGRVITGGASARSLLEVRHLCRQYDGKGGVTDVSLFLPESSIYALVGANGAGKTTTLLVLAGLLFTRSGTLTLRDVPVPLDRYAPRPGLGFVPDEPILDESLTGWQWAGFVCGIKRVSWPEDALDWASTLTLPADALEQPIRSLSFGTRRKLTLWIELMTTASVLLLDEPLIGLDPEAIQGFHVVARRFVQSGRSLLLSTHLLHEAEAFATHVGILGGGVTRMQGPLTEVCAGRSLLATFLNREA